MRSRGEQGLSIAELTIGLAVLLVATTVALSTLVSTQRVVQMGGKETESVNGARIALERMVNEIREALELRPPSGQCPEPSCLIASKETPSGGTIDVRYQFVAASHTLFRATGDWLTGVWNPNVPVAANVRNQSVSVFCRGGACTTPSEEAIRIVLDINPEPSRPSRQFRLTSYVSPRNL